MSSFNSSILFSGFDGQINNLIMNRKQLAAIFLILAFFGVAQAVLQTESLEANLAGGAHLGEDRFSNPSAWIGNRKGASYKVDESVWGNRCLSDLHCTGLRRCSYWGWCQDASFAGPYIPANSA